MSEEVAFKVDPVIAEEICDWIGDGKFLRAYCRQEGKPSWKTVYRWIEKDPEFAEAMERARRQGADAIHEDSGELVDQTPRMEETKYGTKVDAAWVQYQKLRVWRKDQAAAKWHPKRYGERTTLAGDPDAPLGSVPVIQITGYADEKGDDTTD